MTSEIDISGFEEIETLLKDMTISEEDEKKAMKKAMEPLANEIEKNTPLGVTGRLKKLVKNIKKEGFATIGTIKLGAFYDIFLEFGTSKQRKHVGFFERAVNSSQNDAINILSKELLGKIK